MQAMTDEGVSKNFEASAVGKTVHEAIRRGDASRDQRQWSEAVAAYREALDRDPRLAHIWVQYGHACKECGELALAEGAYRTSLQLAPDMADTHLQLGHVLKLMGRRSEAVAAYQGAMQLDPGLGDAQREIAELQRPGAETVSAAPKLLAMPQVSRSVRAFAAETKLAEHHLVFDVSDLIQYFQGSRLPTGIQRVQMQVITSLISDLPKDYAIKVACFDRLSHAWIELPERFFQHLCELAVADGDSEAADWKRALDETRTFMRQAPLLVFPRGAFLINLGSSWNLPNYFMQVRAAKAKYAIRYVPFVHDFIPIMCPEHFVGNLTRDFIGWALGLFQHADHILVNSHSTASDVKRVARHLGHSIDDPAVITLNADFRGAAGRAAGGRTAFIETPIFLKNNVQPNNYVLFVSTIESRKNHLLAFSAWLSMIKKHGVSKVPMLVCVGNRGWLNDAVHAKLAASELLRKRVVMLSHVSDWELELLYKNCLFTLYPSEYEGWGLPVTESLCYGKVPVLSTSSSLPEAGGDFAEYFPLGSEIGLLKAVERLIYDRAYCQQLERKIANEFRPRTWAEIGAQVAGLVRDWASTSAVPGEQTEVAGRGIWPFAALTGRYYAVQENTEVQMWPGMVSGEMFRQGEAWWGLESWGCWTKPDIAARLAFLADLPRDEAAVLFVGIRGVPGTAGVAKVSLEGVGVMEVTVGANEDRWLAWRLSAQHVAELRKSSGKVLFDLLLQSNTYADFGALTNGADTRFAAMGVRGFLLCAESDVQTRLRFVESVMTGDLSSMTGKPVDGTGLFAPYAEQAHAH